MNIKGVFFDLYGTLFRYGDMSAAWADWLSAIHACLQDCGFETSRESLAGAWNGFFLRPEPPPRGELTIFERRIHTACSDLGLNLAEPEARKVASAGVDAWRKYVTLDPEAIEVLTVLSDKTLAVVSNYDHPPGVYSLLDKHDLSRFFAAVVVSGEVGVKKPDPMIFSFALDRTGLDPAQVVYVGDTQEDVQAAKAAGILPIRILREPVLLDYTSNGLPEPPASTEDSMTISRLSDLKGLF